MTIWLAHSEGKNPPVPAQTYQKHITEVLKRTEKSIEGLSPYYKGDLQYFREVVRAAAIFHDLGKLDDENQKVLAKSSGKGLPINHVDAGTANLIEKDYVESALLIYSHHIGLQSIPEESAKEELFLRDANINSHTQQYLKEYLSRHNQLVNSKKNDIVNTYSDWTGLTRRIALSCIVDADHGDTAYNYGKEYSVPKIEERWTERLHALDNYVESLGKENEQSKRNLLRKRIYHSCKEADADPFFYACDSPVGSGKTTAVMAHLLKTAIEKKLRHIIVVLPYTNIIKQSVDIYRKALILPGEKADEVVAEHHHQADFDALSTRQLASLWKSPIIVTTAVQFFETIASNHPSKLRKLHELPGSGVFIDEVHSAIPNHLWPQTWKWMKEFSEKWSCYFVFASGSLPRFWELKDMIGSPETIPELVPEYLRKEALQQEEERIKPISHNVVLDADGLVNLIFDKDKLGPRLVIMNTVQSAAVLANKLAKSFYGEEYRIDPNSSKVLHMSTSLAPTDREIIVETIKNRLQLPMDDENRNFTLIATSCVEAGIDFSFRSAFRERAGAANLIQVGGRVRRNNEDFEPTLIDFRVSAPLFNRHPAFKLSSQILERLFEENKVAADSPADLITEALRRELMSDTEDKHKRLQKMEDEMDYPEVANLYKVIASDTRLVVVDKTLIEKLEGFQRIDPKELNRKSVQLWANKINKLGLDFVKGYENSNLYAWPYNYDPNFLGYMQGVLPLLERELSGVDVI